MMEASSNYVLLGNEGGPLRRLISAKAAAGALLSLCFLSLGSFFSPHKPFTPKTGLDSVTAKPGLPSLLQLGPPLNASEASPFCVLAYGSAAQQTALSDPSFRSNSHVRPARWYGAALASRNGQHTSTKTATLAHITGQTAEYVQGDLICWTALPPQHEQRKLAVLQQVYAAHHAKLQSGVYFVVCQDGSAVPAHVVFEASPWIDAEQQAVLLQLTGGYRVGVSASGVDKRLFARALSEALPELAQA
eukprot:g43581.t1